MIGENNLRVIDSRRCIIKTCVGRSALGNMIEYSGIVGDVFDRSHSDATPKSKPKVAPASSAQPALRLIFVAVVGGDLGIAVAKGEGTYVRALGIAVANTFNATNRSSPTSTWRCS